MLVIFKKINYHHKQQKLIHAELMPVKRIDHMLVSDYRELCEVDLPYRDRQKYMHSFNLENPIMAPGFEDYLDVVKKLCASAGDRSCSMKYALVCP